MKVHRVFTEAGFCFCFAAMSQRNVLEPPDVLYSQEDELREMLLEFFEEHLQDQFPEADYTFDVYITTAGKVHMPADILLCVVFPLP